MLQPGQEKIEAEDAPDAKPVGQQEIAPSKPPERMMATCAHCGQQGKICSLDAKGQRICKDCEINEATKGDIE